MGRIIAKTTTRVEENTPRTINERIRLQTQQRLAHYRGANAAKIADRIAELDREWDIERVLEANAASLTLLSLLLGRTASRAFYLLPAAIAGFLLQHAIQGWCPPIGPLRRLGVRTAREIEEERCALLALRRPSGDGRVGHRRGHARPGRGSS